MTFEIERRFLIKNDLWKEFITQETSIEQGYLSHTLNNWITRIRYNGKDFKIALKKHIKNFTNYEFEYSIPTSDGKKIMSTLKNTIKKDRYFLEIAQQKWIVDCFKEQNHPLKIAEIEVDNEKDEIILPSFLSHEITGIKNFTNFNLSTHPFSTWSTKDFKNFKND